MKIKKNITLAMMLCASFVFALTVFTTTFTKQQTVILSFAKNDNYEKLWKRVDSCQEKGLTESALKIVTIIYSKAKTENNAPQFVKAILHRMKFESYKEEFSLEKSIFKLQDEVKEAKFPIKPVLQNILADAFWQYYQNNRWKFHDRSTTVNFKNDDIQTWDLKTLTNAVIVNYHASLKSVDSLKRTKLNIYDEILYKGTSECREWRPTLYDFLAQRSLAFFMNTEADVSKAANQFNLNDENYLKPYVDFVTLKIQQPTDSFETNYFALQLLQDLTKFHISDSKPDALMDVELQRLDYVYRNSQHAKKDTLYFNTLKALQNKFSINERVIEIDTRIANWHLQQANNYNPLKGDKDKWHRKTAKEICESAIKKFPNSYGAKESKNILQAITNKACNLSIEEVNEPNKPFRALITSANVNKLYFKVVKTTAQDLRIIFRKQYDKKLFEKLNSLPVAKSFTQELMNDGDYNSHNTEIKIPELPEGYYVILYSLTDDFKYYDNINAYTTCVVSNIASIERRNVDGSYDIYTMHRQTGDVLPNVTEQIWFDNYDYNEREQKLTKGETLKTDAKGFLHLKNDLITNRQFYIEYINGNDSYYNNQGFYTYKQNQTDYTQIRSFIYTDRAIYRPGQTVYFKSIVLQNISNEKHELKINYPVTVTFYDVNYQKIKDVSLTTNEFGTLSGSFTAPQGGLLGQMQITDGHGSAYLSVEEYKRPKFETEFNTVKGSYKLNDEVTVTGFAKAYAGNFVDGAKVNYRVVRTTNYPYWYWWYRPYNTNNNDVEITNGETVSNDTGTYSIKFKALPNEADNKTSYATYNYKVMADVVDINGETHSTETNVTVGYQAIELTISNEDIIDVTKSKPIKITTNNLNGAPESTKGNFAIYKLKQPQKVFRNRLWPQADRQTLTKNDYYKTFPNDLYADEANKYTWERESKVLDKTFDTGLKTEYNINTELKNLNAGVYLIEAICKDKFGEEVKAINYVTLINSTVNSLPELQPDWFYCPITKAEPNEKIQFSLASGYGAMNYLSEV